ncbi:MAG: TlpA disulfide reductase family protein [Flavobacteriaceae bacterium]
MSKRLIFLVISLTVMSCAKRSEVNYAIISGTIKNNSSKEITVARVDRSFKKVISLKDDGSFLDTLEVNGPVTYVFNRHFQICLEEGYNLQMNYDATSPTSTLQIIGKGSDINNYLKESEKVSDEIKGKDFDAFYNLNKMDFRKKVFDIKKAKQNLLNSLTGISEDLRKREELNIHYNYLLFLDQYPEVNVNILGSDVDNLVFVDIVTELKDLDYMNDRDFQYSQAYVVLTDQYYNDRVTDRINRDNIDRESAFFNVMNEIPVGPIRNSLLYGIARMDLSNSLETKKYYERFMSLSTNEFHKNTISETFSKIEKLLPGEQSPAFVDYENFTGGSTSLMDLNGKYLYIDLWATWCKPCLAEIPALKILERAYENKNIEFVSISIDKKKDFDKWKQLVRDKQLGGTQLIADNAWESEFVQSYQIIGIPRFILLDPEGRIVDAKASSPSSGQLEIQFKQLGL